MTTTPTPSPFPKDPEITINAIRSVIPKHCFERSYLKSFYWLSHDLILVAICFYLGTFISLIPFITLRIAAWFVYWYVQGAFMTGLWVLAHECGHHGFSPNKIFNNCVGYILHTMLLVPYFAWQFTHKQHHSKTNNLQKDTVHVPRMKFAKSPNEIFKPSNRGVFDRMKRIFQLTVLGWPAYLILDVTGPPAHDEISWVNHFNPNSKYFPPKMANFVLFSDIGLIIWIWFLYKYIFIYIGIMNLLFYYFIPYLIVNHWLVTITFLQHTDWNIDRYTPSEWTWMRGAFGTIDRDYGIFLNYAHHHIADTHVVHHLFSTLPHYNAVEATNAVLKSGVIDKYYISTNESWYMSLWRIIGEGKWQKKSMDILQLKH